MKMEDQLGPEGVGGLMLWVLKLAPAMMMRRVPSNYSGPLNETRHKAHQAANGQDGVDPWGPAWIESVSCSALACSSPDPSEPSETPDGARGRKRGGALA